jgi:8-oxo-dGTP pyrophosphatase MutT (NUDIX family)
MGSGKENKGKKQVKIKRQFSAGGVVFKLQNEKESEREPLWLITKSTPSKLFPGSVWRLPKGWIDDNDKGTQPGPIARGEKKANEEELRKAAVKEVGEEGGVKVKIVGKIGTEKYFITIDNARLLKFVTFYLMEWEENLSEGFGFETQEVRWLAYDKARKRLSYSGEKRVLDKAKELFDKRK